MGAMTQRPAKPAKKKKKNTSPLTWSLMVTSWRYQTKEYFEKSTLHGVRYMAEEGRPFCERFMWFCLTSIGTIVTLIIIVSLWEKFQTNPTITGLDADFHSWDVPFPSVSLCPADPTNHSLIRDYVQSTWGNSSENEEKYFDFVRAMSLLNITDMGVIRSFAEDTSLSDLPTSKFEDILFKVVNSCADVIFDCEWKGSPYNCCEGFNTVLTEVGFCFIFNSRHGGNTDDIRLEENNFKPHQIYETDSKWSLEVDIHDVENNNVRVYIHTADEIPNLDMEPQHNWKRTINKIMISEKMTYSTDDVRHLSIRQRRCVFPQEIKLLTAHNYTYTSCMLECRMKKALEVCGCVPYFYRELDDYPHCDLQGLVCLADNNAAILHELTCSCELGCMNTVYIPEMLIDIMGPSESTGLPDKTTLEIAFFSWPNIRFKREILFGWVDLLVSFGGIAGLFLGFSLLSGVEIVYYFTMRACCMLYRDRDQLRTLQTEYESRPRPPIDLSLRPSFLPRKPTVRPAREVITVAPQEQPIFNVPFLH